MAKRQRHQNQKEGTLLLTLQKYQVYEENTTDHIPANQITYIKQIPRQTTKTDSRKNNLNKSLTSEDYLNNLITSKEIRKHKTNKTTYKGKVQTEPVSQLNSIQHLNENTDSSQIL